MAECSRHPGNVLPGCYFCRTGTEPGDPYIPCQDTLNADTEEALARARAMAASIGKSHILDGMTAIIAVQFPDVPVAVLGRIVLSEAMAAGSVVAADLATGLEPLDGSDVVDLLAITGALLAGEGKPDD